MKQSLSIAVLFALLAISAFAQEPGENLKFKTAADGKVQIELAKAMGAQFGFETKVVKGAPYSAVAEAETIQMLTDGNRIRNKTATTVYRDGEGRTRKEMAGKTPDVPAQVFISDPVSGANYSLNPQQRVAVKSPGKDELRVMLEMKLTDQELKRKTAEGGAPIAAIGQGVNVEQLDEAKRVALEQKVRATKEMKEEMKLSGKIATAEGGVIARKKPGTTESLGQQTIEGVLCEGKRTTITIPANAIGNDLPINIVSEEWYSPELQVLVLTKHSDPRHGETIYRLTNINRSEPARALFEVPADYTLKEPPAFPLKKRAPEEQ